jgi:hypothetical protein
MSLRDPKKQLPNYISDIFFETGTYKGQTARLASDVGFKRVITVELQEYLYEESKLMSKEYDNIEFHLGDSPSIMFDVLSDIDDRITFWLDAHIDPGNYIPGKTPEIRKCPLVEELDIIKSLKRKDNIILIDDIRAFRKYYGEISPDLDMKIEVINSDGEEEVVDLPIGISFFWPDAGV